MLIDGVIGGIEDGRLDMLGSCDQSEFGADLRVKLGTMLDATGNSDSSEACKEG